LNIDEWQVFLKRISNHYTENDKNHYLVERSLQISSREFSELSKRFEDAQHIAQLG